ncbi:MAG: hypothetical protein DMF84_04665 [Acidobacteria bacterium]|nr:MAG: hypothetical protein DMF84_04665 [Acidobacteriota bacterium]
MATSSEATKKTLPQSWQRYPATPVTAAIRGRTANEWQWEQSGNAFGNALIVNSKGTELR